MLAAPQRETRPHLFVKPQVEAFDSASFDKLRGRLQQDSVDATIISATAVEELLLRRDGTLNSQYRYSAAAMRRVCAELAPGLFPLLSEVAGERGRDPGQPDAYDLGRAVDIFNSLLRLRFEARLCGRFRLLLNTRLRRVEAVMGRRYQHLENIEFVDHTLEVVAGAGLDAEFSAALLVGRHLAIDYLRRQPIASLPWPGGGSDEYRAGYHFANSEVSGQASVRAAVLLIRIRTGGRAIGVPGRGKGLRHSGRDFRQRLQQLLGGAMAVGDELTELPARIAALRQQTLGYTGDVEKDRRQSATWASWLIRAGVASRLAKEVAAGTLLYGAYERPDRRPTLLTDPDSLQHYPVAGRAERSLYDLFCLLMWRARHLPPAPSEQLARVAYEFLFARLKP